MEDDEMRLHLESESIAVQLQRLHFFSRKVDNYSLLLSFFVSFHYLIPLSAVFFCSFLQLMWLNLSTPSVKPKKKNVLKNSLFSHFHHRERHAHTGVTYTEDAPPFFFGTTAFGPPSPLCACSWGGGNVGSLNKLIKEYRTLKLRS